MDNLEIESNSHIQQEHHLEPYMEVTMEIEDTVLNRDISEFEPKISDEITTDEFSLKHHCDESSKHDREEPVQHVASIKHQDGVNEGEQFSSVQIKKEELPTEEPYEPFTVAAIKIEDPDLNWDATEFECNVCALMFADQISLQHHVYESHQDDCEEKPTLSVESTEQQDGGKLYKCERPNCGKFFKTKSELGRHLVIHNDERPYNCQQSGCTLSFKRKDKMISHMKSVHSDDRLYKCEEIGCNKSFKRKDKLTVHMRSVHSDERPFVCQQIGCTKSFKRKDKLTGHVRAVHSDVNSFKYEELECSKSFKKSKIN